MLGRKRKRKIKLKTVIRRARSWLKDGHRSGADLAVFTYTDYSLAEAKEFVDFIEQFNEPDALTAERWCEEHRAPRFDCAKQHAQEEPDPMLNSPRMASNAAVDQSMCICRHADCSDQWHRVMMWIRDNPYEWQCVLEEQASTQIPEY